MQGLLHVRTSNNRILQLTAPSAVKIVNYDTRLSIGFELHLASNAISRMTAVQPAIRYRVRQENNRLYFDFQTLTDRDAVIANAALADLVPHMQYNQSTNRTGRRFVLMGVPNGIKNLMPTGILNHVVWFREEIAKVLGVPGISFSIKKMVANRCVILVHDVNLVNHLIANPVINWNAFIMTAWSYPHVEFCRRCHKVSHVGSHDLCRSSCARCLSTEHQASACKKKQPRCVHCSSVRAHRAGQFSHRSDDSSCPVITGKLQTDPSQLYNIV